VEKFWSLVQTSVITTSAVTLVLTGVLSYLWIAGQDVPGTLLTTWLVLLGVTGGKLPEVVQALRKVESK
jgi:hypothetical protein